MSILVVETRSARRRVVSVARVFCLSRVRDDFHNSIPPLHHPHHLSSIFFASIAYESIPRRIFPKKNKKTIVKRSRNDRNGKFSLEGGGGRAIEIDRIHRTRYERKRRREEEERRRWTYLQKRYRVKSPGILPGGRRHVVSAGTRLPTLHHEFLVHAGRNQPILKTRPVVVPRARGALPSTDYRRSICVSSAQQQQQDLNHRCRVIIDDDRTVGLAVLRSRSMTPNRTVDDNSRRV